MNPNTIIYIKAANQRTRSSLRRTQHAQFPLTSMRRQLAKALSIIGVALSGAASAPAQTYTLTQINPPPGAASSGVVDMNDEGQVIGNTSVKAGRSNVPGPAFVWESDAARFSLPALPNHPAARANGISNTGIIVGHSPALSVYDPAKPNKAVWWQKNTATSVYQVGDWNALLNNSSVLLTEAIAISNDGQFVVFDATHSEGVYAPVVAWVLDGMIVKHWVIWEGLSAQPMSYVVAEDISSNASTVRMTGWYDLGVANTGAHAFLWEVNYSTAPDEPLVTALDEEASGHSSSYFPNGLNGVGELLIGKVTRVAGTTVYSSTRFRATSGALIDIPTFGGRTYAYSTSETGLVAGTSARTGKNVLNHAFLWKQGDTELLDLNWVKSAPDTSGIELTSAIKINENRQILAYGVRKGVGVKVLMNPLP